MKVTSGRLRRDVQVLPISTRGVGLAACALSRRAPDPAEPPPIYQMYRVFLGLLEAKLTSLLPFYDVVGINCFTYYRGNLNYLRTAQTVAVIPEPIKHIIDAIDVITLNGKTYVPMVRGPPIPQAGSILLSHLHAVVYKMSSEETPIEDRIVFQQQCPIPGAVWENNLLQNGEEIMPQDYFDNFDEELNMVLNYSSKLRAKYPRMAEGVLAESRLLSHQPSSSVSKAALLSTRMGTLRAAPRLKGESVKEYCERCVPCGNSGPSHTLEPMSSAEILDGQVGLLGEYPRGEGDEPPTGFYTIRKPREGSIVSGDYLTAKMATEAIYFYDSGGLGTEGEG